MIIRCQIISMLSGCVWLLIAGATGAVKVFDELWLAQLVTALITGLFVGNLMCPLLSRCPDKFIWYVLLPLLSILLGTGLFGLLLPVSWKIAGQGLEAGIFFQMPLIFIIESMTYFLPIFYPLALLNNWLIYRFTRVR